MFELDSWKLLLLIFPLYLLFSFIRYGGLSGLFYNSRTSHLILDTGYRKINNRNISTKIHKLNNKNDKFHLGITNSGRHFILYSSSGRSISKVETDELKIKLSKFMKTNHPTFHHDYFSLKKEEVKILRNYLHDNY